MSANWLQVRSTVQLVQTALPDAGTGAVVGQLQHQRRQLGVDESQCGVPRSAAQLPPGARAHGRQRGQHGHPVVHVQQRIEERRRRRVQEFHVAVGQFARIASIRFVAGTRGKEPALGNSSFLTFFFFQFFIFTTQKSIN